MEYPSNYLSYYTGYLEFLNMREEAQQRLGANFSLLEFNRFLLDIGPAPFSVIRNYFTQWLMQNGSSNFICLKTILIVVKMSLINIISSF